MDTLVWQKGWKIASCWLEDGSIMKHLWFESILNGIMQIPDSKRQQKRSHGWHPVADVRCSHNYPRSRGRRRPQAMQRRQAAHAGDQSTTHGRPRPLSQRSLRPMLSRRTRRRSSLNCFKSLKQVSNRFLTRSNIKVPHLNVFFQVSSLKTPFESQCFLTMKEVTQHMS